MPFGLTNAPSTYQRAIDTTLKMATNSFPNVDLTLVHSVSMTSHLQDLRCALECYRHASMQLRRDKFKFGYEEIEFVGHIITAEGHRPLPWLIEKIKAQLRPSSPRKLKAFLGLANYYREFLPNAVRIASPLYNLTCGGVQWEWTPQCEESFHVLRDSLAANAITLAYPRWDQTFFV